MEQAFVKLADVWASAGEAIEYGSIVNKYLVSPPLRKP